MSEPKYIVIEADDWAELMLTIAMSGHGELLDLATEAPLAEDTFVIRETDTFGPAGLFSFAANIRTAVEFTEATGLSVMTNSMRDDLNDRANDIVMLGVSWQESMAAQANATVQQFD